jgi:nitrilase
MQTENALIKDRHRLDEIWLELKCPWLDKKRGTEIVLATMAQASAAQADLVVFPESYLPGYPWWAPRTDGARFEAPDQRAAYAYFLEAAVDMNGSEIRSIRQAAADFKIAVCLGTSERDLIAARGTVYCTAVMIGAAGQILSTHRKLMPTYDERLVWGIGDGHGLGAVDIGGTRVSVLNCWENLMPLARHTAYADGTDIHVSLWPGAPGHTELIGRFIGYEGRVWSVAVCGIYELATVPEDFPLKDALAKWPQPLPFRGGTAVADPTGSWILEPVVGREVLVIGDFDPRRADEARLDFDPVGHYARPDVFSVSVRRDQLRASHMTLAEKRTNDSDDFGKPEINPIIKQQPSES